MSDKPSGIASQHFSANTMHLVRKGNFLLCARLSPVRCCYLKSKPSTSLWIATQPLWPLRSCWCRKVSRAFFQNSSEIKVSLNAVDMQPTMGNMGAAGSPDILRVFSFNQHGFNQHGFNQLLRALNNFKREELQMLHMGFVILCDTLYTFKCSQLLRTRVLFLVVWKMIGWTLFWW